MMKTMLRSPVMQEYTCFILSVSTRRLAASVLEFYRLYGKVRLFSTRQVSLPLSCCWLWSHYAFLPLRHWQWTPCVVCVCLIGCMKDMTDNKTHTPHRGMLSKKKKKQQKKRKTWGILQVEGAAHDSLWLAENQQGEICCCVLVFQIRLSDLDMVSAVWLQVWSTIILIYSHYGV